MNKKTNLTKILFSIIVLSLFVNSSLLAQVQTGWENRFSSTWGLKDFGRKLRISDDGNVYVGGHSFTGGDEAVITLIKYDPNGSVVWQEHSQVGVRDYMEDMILGNDGYLYLVGDYWNGSDFDMLVTKYDRDGNLIWRSTFNGGYWDRAVSIDVDSEGSVYIVGHVWHQPEFYNITLVKFNHTGNYEWHKTYTSTGQHSDFGHKVKVDPSDNIYVSGNANMDLVLSKYSRKGDLIWQNTFNTNFVWEDIQHNFIELDSEANILICGNIYNQGSKEDILILKYSPEGNLMWNKMWNSPGNNSDFISYELTDNALAIDHHNNIFVIGTVYNPNINFSEDIVTLKYNSEGVFQWQHIYDGPANDWDIPFAITVDMFGDVYVCGLTVEIVNSLVPEDYLTFKLDGNSGLLLWKETFNGIGDFSDRAYSIGVDKDLNVYVTGISSNDNQIISSNRDIITIKYSQNKVGISQNSEITGTFRLNQNYPNPFNPVTKISYELITSGRITLKVYDISGKEIATLANGEVHTAGYYTVTFDARNIASGMYFYRIIAEGNNQQFVMTKKMILLR
jgi:uncharacterized delta-60 repeat protein